MIINMDNIGGGGGGGYVLPIASQSTLGGVKIGSGVTIDSGGTISVEGGSSAPSYIINDVITGTAQEIQAFYNMMLPMVVSGSSIEGINIYYRSRALGMTDNLTLCASAWYQSAQDFGTDSLTFIFASYSYAIPAGGVPDQYYVNIASDGTVDAGGGNGGTVLHGAGDIDYRPLFITSAGTIVNTDASCLAGNELWHCWLIDSETYTAIAPVKWVNRYQAEDPNAPGETKTVLQFGADVPINGTLYNGIWSVMWDYWNDVYTTSWVSGSTIPADSHYPAV